MTPVLLENAHVRLEPLAPHHAPGLAAVVGDLYRLWYTTVPRPEDMAAEVDRRLALQAEGRLVAWAQCAPGGRPIGMTSYLNLAPEVPRVEIGTTWLAPEVQRSPVNTAAKRLLLGHAFETLGCAAVELRTHALNHRSRRAIERLGARADGILRNHMRMPNGTLRDTACYSITEAEWPTVRAHLDHQQAR